MPSSHLTLCWQADSTTETPGKPWAQGMVVCSLADGQYTGFVLLFPSRHWEARCWPVAGQDKKRMPGGTPSPSRPPRQDKPPLPWGLKWWRVCLQCGRPRSNRWVRKVPWRRAWSPTPGFVPGKCRGQSSLAGYSPWGRGVGHDWATHSHVHYAAVGCVLRSRVWLCYTWAVARRAALSMALPRQEYWSALPFPSPGDLPNPGIKPASSA